MSLMDIDPQSSTYMRTVGTASRAWSETGVQARLSTARKPAILIGILMALAGA
jgi:hypothetical protein